MYVLRPKINPGTLVNADVNVTLIDVVPCIPVAMILTVPAFIKFEANHDLLTLEY